MAHLGATMLWQPEDWNSWGRLAMEYSGSIPHPPTRGSQQPSYDYLCYGCGRPITESGQNHWMDHAGRNRCDRALMGKTGFPWHLPTHRDEVHDDGDDEGDA
jgi:hypothetical protein